MKNVAVQITDVSKVYEIHHEKPTLVEKFVKGPNETFWALKNINLTIKKGERIGIMGPNGSGKTTLLKIIAGIATPTSGSVRTYGNIVSLIDLEAGFHPDLTGEQNIYLNGMILGMPKRKIEKKLDKIIKFADIKQFIDAPLFTYSQGMKLRLGFSVSIHADPDILILDENLNVGDENFRRKSQAVLRQFHHTDKTIILVSHWMEYIQDMCKRIIQIRNGTLCS